MGDILPFLFVFGPVYALVAFGLAYGWARVLARTRPSFWNIFRKDGPWRLVVWLQTAGIAGAISTMIVGVSLYLFGRALIRLNAPTWELCLAVLVLALFVILLWIDSPAPEELAQLKLEFEPVPTRTEPQTSQWCASFRNARARWMDFREKLKTFLENNDWVLLVPLILGVLAWLAKGEWDLTRDVRGHLSVGLLCAVPGLVLLWGLGAIAGVVKPLYIGEKWLLEVSDETSLATRNRDLWRTICLAAVCSTAAIWAFATVAATCSDATCLLEVRDKIQLELGLGALALVISVIVLATEEYAKQPTAASPKRQLMVQTFDGLTLRLLEDGVTPISPTTEKSIALNVVALGTFWTLLLVAAYLPAHVALVSKASQFVDRIPIPDIAQCAPGWDCSKAYATAKIALDLRKGLQDALPVDYSGLSTVTLLSLAAPFVTGLLSRFLGGKIDS